MTKTLQSNESVNIRNIVGKERDESIVLKWQWVGWEGQKEGVRHSCGFVRVHKFELNPGVHVSNLIAHTNSKQQKAAFSQRAPCPFTHGSSGWMNALHIG
jgi:hypothetical protein